jgi:multiple antibiotic resistance protein
MQLLKDFLSMFIPLLVVLDPAGTVPLYLGLTGSLTDRQRKHIAVRASIVAGVTGILFIILGQAIFRFLGIGFHDFQIAGGVLLFVLAIIDLLIPGKPAVDEKAQFDPATSLGVVPLAVPLIVGPATLTTGLLLVNTFGPKYTDRYGSPEGQVLVVAMVCVALVLNMLLLFGAMWHSNRLVGLLGKNTLTVINKIVMILLAAYAVSLIRQGIVSIVLELRSPHSA